MKDKSLKRNPQKNESNKNERAIVYVLLTASKLALQTFMYIICISECMGSHCIFQDATSWENYLPRTSFHHPLTRLIGGKFNDLNGTKPMIRFWFECWCSFIGTLNTLLLTFSWFNIENLYNLHEEINNLMIFSIYKQKNTDFVSIAALLPQKQPTKSAMFVIDSAVYSSSLLLYKMFNCLQIESQTENVSTKWFLVWCKFLG